VELDSTQKKLRRKDNKPVPNLKLLNKKRKNQDENNTSNNPNEEEKVDENPDLSFDP